MSAILERLRKPTSVITRSPTIREVELGNAIHNYCLGDISADEYHKIKDQFWADWRQAMSPHRNPTKGGNRLIKLIYDLMIR